MAKIHFSEDSISLFVKFIRNNAQFLPPVKSLIDVEVLSNILPATMALPYPVVYQALYLFSFFSFLRISNILYPTQFLLLTCPGTWPEVT